MHRVRIIGAGLAGCEAAWYLAENGVVVDLYEMRPIQNTPAHHTDKLAELVCSNSLRSQELSSAAGLLKAEMRLLKSLTIEVAQRNKVPAGGALAVDRHRFSDEITSLIKAHPNITLHREEIVQLPSPPTVIATGPLTSDVFSKTLSEILGSENLYFYDAASPIVAAETICWDKAFWGSRYGKGGDDYVNLPLTRFEYEKFHNALINAQLHTPKKFEEPVFFERCMPIEAIARRGIKTLLFGPLKPVGILDPRTGEEPFAVVQLRKENIQGNMLNIVGFQTSLKWKEQNRVFSLIPGLERVEFIRYGFIHRNTFIDSPKFLNSGLGFKSASGIFFAGQITGVEGYIESAATGIVAGVNVLRWVEGKDNLEFPPETIIGGLCSYITSSNIKNFQPMKANFGILPPLGAKIKSKRDRNLALSDRSISALKHYCAKRLG